MSRLTLKVPTPPIRWWRLQLRPNEAGNVMMISHNGAYNADEKLIEQPTEVSYEFFDGCDTDIVGILACASEQIAGRHYLLMLADHPPTPDPRWEPLNEFAVPSPPYRDEQRFIDVPLFRTRADE